MSMKVTRLYTHWDAEQAHTVIAFLDEVRERLYEIYGEKIVEMLRAAATEHTTDSRQTELDFGEEIRF